MNSKTKDCLSKTYRDWLWVILVLAAFLGGYSTYFILEHHSSSPEPATQSVQHHEKPKIELQTVPQSVQHHEKPKIELQTASQSVQHHEKPKIELQTASQRRIDVPLLTPWLAPIVWDGTFDEDILNEQFQGRNITIGVTIFAIKKYVIFLKLFLETAEKHFMVGYKVNYYVFTDRPNDVPKIPLQEGRKIITLVVQNYSRWQDISMHRMEMISNYCHQLFFKDVDYLVCLDVDMKFNDHVGVEMLSDLVGTLHPGFYGASRETFTYERRPKSQAYIPRGKGDYYYMGGFFGGKVQQVYKLTKACHEAMLIDKSNRIEAVWHDESHLNKYLFLHKPTKVLPPEYMWDKQLLGWPAFLRKMRMLAVPKNHAKIRNK